MLPSTMVTWLAQKNKSAKKKHQERQKKLLGPNELQKMINVLQTRHEKNLSRPLNHFGQVHSEGYGKA